MKALAPFLLLLTLSGGVQAYGPDVHQTLTFVAAKAANRCLESASLPRLEALQVRYLVRANVSLADRNFFARAFRWNYYNRADAGERSWFGMVNTRLHEHFNELVLRLEQPQEPSRRYATLGRIISYLQDVSTPSRAVPVYTNRFWRFSFSDRFDGFAVDASALEAGLLASCEELLAPPDDAGGFDALLLAVANDTIRAVDQPIPGMPSTWQAFWQLAEAAEDFGEFGVAGNTFGRETVFRCGDGERCVLLEDDPLYRDFAYHRHLSAVRATMRAMILLQRASLSEPAPG